MTMRQSVRPNFISAFEASRKICPLTRTGKGAGKRCVPAKCMMWRDEWIRCLGRGMYERVGYCTYSKR